MVWNGILAALTTKSTTLAPQSNDDNRQYPSYTTHRYEWLDYPTCPNTDCTVSIFEYCKAASIGNLFGEYVTRLGFLYDANMGSQAGNTLLKVSLEADTTSIFCSGLYVRRHLLSLMNTQNVEKTGIFILLIE